MVNWVSSCLSFFVSSSTAATYIFIALNCTTAIISPEPCAFNAEYQHFILRFIKMSLLCGYTTERGDRGGVKGGPKTGWRQGYFMDKSILSWRKKALWGMEYQKGVILLPYPFASWNISWALDRFFLTWGCRFFLFLKCTIWKPLAQCFDSRCGVFGLGKRVFKYQRAFLFWGKGFEISSLGFSILSIGVFILKAQSPNLVLEIKNTMLKIKNTPCLESKIPC